jgi:hypothetical protein
MKARIQEQFSENIDRVKNLVLIYETHLAGEGSGRRAHQKTDVLRAATVLLHASLEDLLRSLAYWKLPAASANVLDQFPLAGNGPAMKYSLGALAAHRGRSVDDLIKDSVDSHLERSNYNSTDEVARFLGQIALDVGPVQTHFAELDELMSRRHQIVHRADIDAAGGRGNHRVRSISVATVNKWVRNVEGFSTTLLDQVK